MVKLVHRTKWGLLELAADGERLASVRLVSRKGATPKKIPAVLKRAAREIDQYFRGSRRRFSVPLGLAGTPFQKKVWSALLRVPYGKTISYKSMARAAGKPRAIRAAASAVGDNPVCLLVPCHRVISSNGSLGGYAYGLSRKTALLRLEGALS